MNKKACNFIITINNPQEDIHGVLEKIKASGFGHGRAQLERGEEGTLHIQATFGGKSTRFSVVKKLFPTAHIEQAKHAIKSWEYCGKEETRVEGPVEFGLPPAQKNRSGDTAAKNKLLLEKGAEKAVQDGDISIMQYAKLKHSIELYNACSVKHAQLDKLDNHWIYGKPGVGKSRKARLDYPDYYDKPLNKWWDDYKDQETVVLDDFGLEHSCLATHLKRWADHYPFTAEVKGSAINIRPTRIIVTSNYHPRDIFQDKETQEAIMRRFEVTHML